MQFHSMPFSRTYVFNMNVLVSGDEGSNATDRDKHLNATLKENAFA